MVAWCCRSKDFLLTARRDLTAARRYFERAIDLHGEPEKVTIDRSGANAAAVRGLVADTGPDVELRQSKYLNNLVEQDHRSVKRRVLPMMGFKTFESARKLIAGIETMHMIKKGSCAAPRVWSCPMLTASTASPPVDRPRSQPSLASTGCYCDRTSIAPWGHSNCAQCSGDEGA